MPKDFTANSDYYPSGGVRVGLKEGTNKKWIQKATKNMRKTNLAQVRSLEVKPVPPGSKRYNS